MTPINPNIAMSAGGMFSVVEKTRIGRKSAMSAPCKMITQEANSRNLA